MTVDDKLWLFIIWSSLFILYLGYPKFALLYCVANEVFWEDEEEEYEVQQEENTFQENIDELEFYDIPQFFTPVYSYGYAYPLKHLCSYTCFYVFYKKNKKIKLKNLWNKL
jgi:hypothetical protein